MRRHVAVLIAAVVLLWLAAVWLVLDQHSAYSDVRHRARETAAEANNQLRLAQAAERKAEALDAELARVEQDLQRLRQEYPGLSARPQSSPRQAGPCLAQPVRMPWLPPFAGWARHEHASAEQACASLRGHEDTLSKVELYGRKNGELQELVELVIKLKEREARDEGRTPAPEAGRSAGE